MITRTFLFIAVAAASALLLSFALTTSGIGKNNSEYANGAPQNATDAIAASANASSINTNQTAATNTQYNNTTGTASNDNGTSSNSTALPTEFDWENLTTFELFEKYPILENLTSSVTYNASANTTTNETGTGQSLSLPGMTLQNNNTSQQQNETLAPTTANTTKLPSSMATMPQENNASAGNPGNNNNTNINPNTNNNTNVNINNNTNANTNNNSGVSMGTSQRNASATTETTSPYLLNQLQSTVNSLKQSITELRKDVSNSTSMPINQVVVNQPASSANASLSASNNNDNNANGNTTNNLVFTTSKRIIGDLKEDDYLIVTHLAPYSTIGGRGQIELKVPCTDEEEPKVKLMVGSIPDLREVDLGKAIETGSIEDSNKEVKLSDGGEYCLYHAELPGGITDAIVVNDSEHTLKFSEGRYYVAITGVASLAAVNSEER